MSNPLDKELKYFERKRKSVVDSHNSPTLRKTSSIYERKKGGKGLSLNLINNN